jgi:preprotein translocase subunit SecA
MSIITTILGDPNKKHLAKLEPIVAEINAYEETLQKETDAEIKARSLKLKEEASKITDRNEQNDYLDKILPEAFALVREASKRTIGLRHFDVQLLGGIILHHGSIAEMTTGEGKTLVATLPLYLNSLSGRGVHLITVNDYLARAHAEWMGPIYNFLGISVGCLNHESSVIYQPSDEKKIEEESKKGEQAALGGTNSPNLKPISRKEAYDLDITYGTNNEFGFDYLRDNMATTLEQVAQRELNFAIVDEVDSILIDEARTPLIISAPIDQAVSMYENFAQLVPNLKNEIDYTVDEKDKAVSITDAGIKKVETILNIPNIYEQDGVMLVHHLEEALKAQALFKKNRDYLIKDGEVVIVDEFTGRLMPGRRYSEGLHQAIEAKEGVEIKQESQTMATISFQNLFRIYHKLAGMTGTALTEAEEFFKIYKLDVTSIPTNRVMARLDRPDRVYKTEEGKYKAVVSEVARMNKEGQPVLIGTVSVAKNEKLSRMLKKEGVSHQLLNAKHHDREAKVIARAGEKGAVTVATNMAGRGTDIRLGEGVADLGGLCVIGTERHESRRIDNQLRGRAGRQGDPGESIFFVSMEDDLMRIFGGDRMKNIMNALGLPEDMPIENKMISKSIEGAQKKVEGHNFDIRKQLVEYDDVMNKHREVIYRKRRRILEGIAEETTNEYGEVSKKEVKDEILEIIESQIQLLVNSYAEDQEKLLVELKAIFGDEFAAKDLSVEALTKEAKKLYEEREERFGAEMMRRVEQSIYLRAMDMLWVEHLTSMEELRAGIGLVGYGQRDPLVEYKTQAYGRFQQLLAAIESTLVRNIFKVEVGPDQIPARQPISLTANQRLSLQGASEADAGGGFDKEVQSPKSKAMPAGRQVQSSDQNKSSDKIGRNEPCPCGAKKADGRPVKYKNCCGK